MTISEALKMAEYYKNNEGRIPRDILGRLQQESMSLEEFVDKAQAYIVTEVTFPPTNRRTREKEEK